MEVHLVEVGVATLQTCRGHLVKAPKAGILCSLAKSLEEEMIHHHRHHCQSSLYLQALHKMTIILSDHPQTCEPRMKIKRTSAKRQAHLHQEHLKLNPRENQKRRPAETKSASPSRDEPHIQRRTDRDLPSLTLRL